jgi:hypothetical protein
MESKDRNKEKNGKRNKLMKNIQRGTKKTMYRFWLGVLPEEMLNIYPIERKFLNHSFHILQQIIIVTNDLLNMVWTNPKSFKFCVKRWFLFCFVPQQNQLILLKIL